MGRFGPGERAAISVVLEHRDWLLLLDNVRAFEWAGAQGLRVRCTPLLVVELFLEDEVDGAEALRLLEELGHRRTLSQQLITLARGLIAPAGGGPA